MSQVILGNQKLKFIKGMFYAAPSPPLYENYLTIEALEDGLTVSFSMNTIQYSIDGCNTWIELPAGTATPVIKAGDMISFKATGLMPIKYGGIGYFTINKNFNLLGNVMSMLFGDEGRNSYDLTGYDYAFWLMFSGCATLQSISKNFLPATTLDEFCYWCMFAGCDSLVSVPTLPATRLASNCYAAMFQDCTSLVTAPELPATTLVDGCYASMFGGCTSLVTAPELPATTLANECYDGMFYNCTKLNYIKALFTTTPGSSYTSNWVRGGSSTGTFVKNVNATWNVTGIAGIPTGWTVQTA